MNNPHASAISHPLSAIGRKAAKSAISRLAASALFLVFFGAGIAQAQTYYTMSSGNKTWDFADINNWSNNFASGTDAANWSSVAVNSTGTIPDGVRTTVSSATFQTTSSTGGVQRGNVSGNVAGTIVLLSTGSPSNGAAVAIDLNLNFSGRTAGTLSFDWACVFNQTGDRGGSLRIYTSTDGTNWTQLSSTINVVNNVASSGSFSSVSLPAGFSGNSTARIRFYQNANAVGTTGSRPKISIDNVAVTSSPTATAPTGVTTGSAGSITESGATISTSSVTADGGSAITERGVVYATTSNPTISNTKVTASGTTGNFDSTLTGLAASTTYYVRAYATNSVGTTYGSEVSFTTLSASTPTISPSTATLTGFTATYPSAGTAQSLTVNATNLTPASGSLTVTGSTNYEISTTSSSTGFGDSATLNYSSSTISSGSANVWIRLKASRAVASYNSETIAITGGGATQQNLTVSGSVSNGTPPTLTANATATVDGAFVVTFADNATWRGQISSITVDGTTLTAGYSVGPGTITFTPSASSPLNLLQTSGSKAIIVNASNYAATTSLSQTIAPGAAHNLAVTTQPAAPASNGAALATQPVVTIRDQYNNTATGSSASVTAAVGSGTWTLGGTTAVNASSGVATFSGLTATSAAAVTGATINFTSSGLTGATSSSFNIPVPTLCTYAFAGSTGSLAATGVATNASAGSISLTNITQNGNAANAFSGSRSWGSSFSTSNYLEFTVSASAGYLITPSSLALDVWRSSQGATNYVIRSSVDSYTANLSTGTVTTTQTSITPVALSAGSFSGLSSVTFRIYGWGGSSTGDFRLDNIVLSGSVAVNTTPTLTAATLGTALSTTSGTASAGVSFTAQGTNLTSNILVTAQSGYEVSTSSGSGYGASVSVASGTTVWVRFASSQAAGTYNSAIAAVLSSTGAANVNLTTFASNNIVLAAEPATQATNVTAGTPTVSTIPSLTATNGNGARRAVFIAAASSGTAAPVDGTTYTANTAFGSGTQIGSTGWFCIYDGIDNPISGLTVTGLASGTTYRVMVCEYNGSGATANYNGNSATGNPANFTTDTPTVLTPGDIALIELQSDEPDNFAFVALVDIKAGTTVNFTDNAWTGSALATNEGTLTWTATSAVSRGTVVTYDGTSFSTGSVSGSNFALSANGDAIIAYQGTSGSPTFVYALASNSWITTSSTSTATSYLPTGLTNGTTARDFSSEIDNNYFNVSSVTGNRTTILSSIGNTDNWLRNNDVQTNPSWSFTVKDDQTITFGALSAVTYGIAPFALTATASSGLTVDYTSSNTSVATISGSTVTIVGAGSTTITANQTGNATFNAAADVPQTLTVNPKALTGSFTANNKVYDGNTSASVATRAVSGKVGADDVNHTGGTATFDTASVGTVKTVTLAGASLTGTAAANYSLASISTTTANITTAALTITGISIANKTYDGTDAATITGTAAYSGLVNSESHSVTGTATALFGNSTVGSNKPVTVSGYTAPNGNYSITQPTGLTGNITAASVTVTAGNQTKAFGSSDPTLTYTPSPALIAGNSFSGALSRAAGEGVGTYAISQGTLSAGSNYTISFVGANLTITQATASITTPPTASTITSGQALSSSVLSGGVANVAGSFAFTTPGTVPSPGVSSQGVTFTPTDTGNYTTQTTSVNVGVLCTAPVLTRGSNPTGTGFTVNWGAVTGAANYTVIHSANKNMSDATSADTTSTSLTLTASPGIRYVQVRANNAAGSSANSTMQVNQLQSINAGATVYLSVPGVVNGGNATIAEKFGSANEAGLAAGGNASTSTNIILLDSNGSSQAGIYYLSGNWVRGDSIVNTETVPAGKAFMLKNNSSAVDHILLVGTPAEGPRTAVTLSANSSFTLVTTGRTSATPIAGIVAGNVTATPSSPTDFKAASRVADADQIIVPPVAPGSPNEVYYYNPNARGGPSWMRGNLKVSSETIPSGRGFFIRKGNGSTLTEWTPPAEE